MIFKKLKNIKSIKNIKANSLHEFSIKDVISLILIFTFLISIMFVIYDYLKNKDITLLELVKVQISIVLGVLTIYGGSELTTGIVSKLQDSKRVEEATQIDSGNADNEYSNKELPISNLNSNYDSNENEALKYYKKDNESDGSI